MNLFKDIKFYLASIVVGAISHWVALHPHAVDPFYVGTLIGAICHALGVPSPTDTTGGGTVVGSVNSVKV